MDTAAIVRRKVHQDQAAADSVRRAHLDHLDRAAAQASATAEAAAVTAVAADRVVAAADTAAAEHLAADSAGAHSDQWVHDPVDLVDRVGLGGATIRAMLDPSRPKQQSS